MRAVRALSRLQHSVLQAAACAPQHLKHQGSSSGLYCLQHPQAGSYIAHAARAPKTRQLPHPGPSLPGLRSQQVRLAQHNDNITHESSYNRHTA
jgi:hypothetical protein